MQGNNDLDADVHQHDVHAFDGCRSGSQFLASGSPMAMAPVAYCLWQKFLRFDPLDPTWPNRDRFVLSAGHASMLLYSLLHLTGVKAVSKDYEILGEPSVPLEAIQRFRQLAAGAPAIRSTAGPAASRPPPAHSGKGWPTASV